MNIWKNLFLVPIAVMLLQLGAPAAVNAQQRTLGPVLKIYTDPFVFDTVFCGVRRCLPLTLHNVGDTTLVVHNHDRAKRPFYLRIDTPLVLQPGEMRTFDLCYNAYQYSKDSQEVFLRADTRLPLSIAMVHDFSSSMYLMMPDGKRRYEGAHDAGNEFIGNLLDTLGIEDEAAVFSFDDDENFAMKQTWTKDTAALRAAIPDRPMGTATCIFNAISRVIDSMISREKMRVLIVVTDGEDSGSPPCKAMTVDQVIKKARDNDVRIYAITIGSIDRAPLVQIVTSSGGKEFNATQSSDLLAIYREIAVDMSKNVTRSVFMKGESAGPRLEIIPSVWEFDSVQVGETACEEVLIRNGGNAWLRADSVRKVFVPPYSLVGLDVDSIAPYQTLTASVCFTPTVPRHYEIPMPFFPSPCDLHSDSLVGRGNSFLLPRDPRKNPLLEIGELTKQPDTTFCRTTECTTLELRNSSDTTLTVRELDPVLPPFSCSVEAPFTLDPGTTRSITICYRPPDAPRTDTLRLSFTADARVPQRMAMLFDQSQSMSAEFMPGLSRMVAAAAGANDFIDGLEFRSGFTDAVALARFDSAGVFEWSGEFATDRDSLRRALPETTSKRIACVYDAAAAMLNQIGGSTEAPRCIVLFTSGEDAGPALCGALGVADVAARAAVLKTRIHCVQLGDADSTDLEQLAQISGGRYLRPRTLLQLILGLREIEQDLSRDVRFERTIIGRGVTPILTVENDTLDFGSSVFVEGSTVPVVRSQRLANVGDAPMHLRLEGVEEPFALRPPSPPGTAPRNSGAMDTLVNPGESVVLDVGFLAAIPGEHVDTMMISHDGCVQPTMNVVLRGRTVSAFNGPWRYPSAVASPPPLRFDTMSCGTTQCLEIAFASTDSRGTTVKFVRDLEPPFFADLPDSIAVEGGGLDTLEVCYRPDDAGVHDEWLVFDSETRPSLSTVFLLASGRSSLDTLAEGLAFRDLTREARSMYARWARPGDEAALMAFDRRGSTTLVEYSSDHSAVASAEPDTSMAPPGDLADAMIDAMIYAAAHAQGRSIVVAMVSDAAAMTASDVAALRTRALQDGVVLAIAATGDEGYRALSPNAPSAARFDSCFTLAALQSFVYRATLDAVETKRDSVRLSGTATAAKMDLDPLVLDFGTLRIGEQACLPVTIRNSGSAPLEIIDVVNPAGPPPAGFPRTIAANESTVMDICYTVSQLRGQSAEILVIFDGCRRDTISVKALGRGTDSLGVGIDATLRGMPGSVVRIPVKLSGRLTASYGVRDFQVALSYNKTLLYPLDELIINAGTVSAGMSGATVRMKREFSDSSLYAVTTYTVSGGTAMSMEGSAGVLLEPPFLVLHGDAMQTPLLVADAYFADGLPVAGITSSGIFYADSLGFHEQRLVDASGRYNASVIGTYPNPFNPSVTIVYELRQPAAVRLSVHDALGREVRLLDSGTRGEGRHRVSFDASGRPSGLYFYRLESGGVMLSGSMLHLK